MRPVEGNLQHRGTPSAGWKNPLSSPAMMLATSKIMALVWAFQQQGWAAFIPCLMVLAGRIARLRWSKFGLRLNWSDAFGQGRFQTKSPAACNMRRGFLASVRPDQRAAMPLPLGASSEKRWFMSAAAMRNRFSSVGLKGCCASDLNLFGSLALPATRNS